MIIELLLKYFEFITFLSVICIVMGFFLLFFLHKKNVSDNKNIILNYVNILNNSNKETKDYLIGIGNILEQQTSEISKQIEKISFLERAPPGPTPAARRPVLHRGAWTRHPHQ